MKISIALCTYNGEKYIKEQLDSLISQTLKPDEIIISDDGSDDSTLAIVEEILIQNTIPYKILRHDTKLGVYKNFSVCMQACSGDLIFPCDQDDIWQPTKCQSHVDKHMESPQANLVYSNADVIYETIDNYLYPLWPPKEIKSGQYHSISNLVYKGKSIAGFCMSIKSEFFHKILPIPNNVFHDDWCATCASIHGSIIGISTSLAYYRQHSKNVVGIIRGNKLSFYKSLFTNVPFYIESDRYIFSRNQIVFTEIKNRSYLLDFISVSDLNDVQSILYSHTVFTEMSLFANLELLSRNLVENRYRLFNGIFTYFKDIYDMVFMKLIKSSYKS